MQVAERRARTGPVAAQQVSELALEAVQGPGFLHTYRHWCPSRDHSTDPFQLSKTFLVLGGRAHNFREYADAVYEFDSANCGWILRSLLF